MTGLEDTSKILYFIIDSDQQVANDTPGKRSINKHLFHILTRYIVQNELVNYNIKTFKQKESAERYISYQKLPCTQEYLAKRGTRSLRSKGTTGTSGFCVADD
ncbi:hypothetical protein AVEN_194786-1 [Araneus ventricosus]|uniref:Uncharacterized protein n=1 Tax=Araneus ventricosus TaxID=182803 RepID=A0A4Y2B5E0_ARAVE|nr:hypothetical protein AVEN_194786-1 [Araneus ventricosus]